jgi:hypothetical protein
LILARLGRLRHSLADAALEVPWRNCFAAAMNMRVLLVAIWVGLAAGVCGATAVDEAKPYGRACVTVVDAAAKTEALLAAGTPPGPERFVTVHLDANSPCEVLVVAFAKKDGRLAFGWRPAVLTLPQWEERTVGQGRWAWKQTGEQFEVFALFFAPGSADAAQIKKLVAAMQEPKSEAKMIEMQTQKLHELIGHAMADKDLSKFRAKEKIVEVAGAVRGDSFPWREFASGANFITEQPGVLIFPSASAK